MQRASTRVQYSAGADVRRLDFVTLQVSHDRLELLDEAHWVEAGSDAAQSAKARNSIEKMLCHELAGTHRVINENDGQVNVGRKRGAEDCPSLLYFAGHERLNKPACCIAAWVAQRIANAADNAFAEALTNPP